MLYTVIVIKNGEELVFKHIKSFFAEPGRIKLFKEKWIPIDGVEGLILHEESDMSRLSDDEKRYFTDQISMLKNENERLTDRVEVLEAENEKRILYGAELAQERNDLKKENKVLRELLKQANKFNVLSKIESAPAWDSDSPFQQEIDALLTGEQADE